MACAPMRPIDWEGGDTSLGEFSRKVHAFKHSAHFIDYEERCMKFLDRNLPEYSGQLSYDLEYHDHRKRRALWEKYQDKVNTMKAAKTTKKQAGSLSIAERHAARRRHAQDGSPRKVLPWVPPFMKTPATAPNSPGYKGLVQAKPTMMERTGGGYTEARKKLVGSGDNEVRFGPLLKGQPPRTSPKHPPRAERALWVGGLPRNAGANRGEMYDSPRDRLFLISSESATLFEDAYRPTTPTTQGPIKVIPATLPCLQRPVFRPTLSKDLYRLYQVLATEPLVM